MVGGWARQMIGGSGSGSGLGLGLGLGLGGKPRGGAARQ